MSRHPSHIRKIGALPAVVLLAAVLLNGCTLGVAENDPGGGVINIDTVPLIAAGDRKPAPDVCGKTITGDELCLADLPPTPVLVNFWASWCGPCAQEVPELMTLADDYKGRVEVVGVNESDTLVNARSFERDQAIDYPSWFDKGAVIASQFGPTGLPTTILLDGEHRIAVRLLGSVSRAQLQPYLDDLIGS